MSATQSIVSQYEDEYIYNADENNSTTYKLTKLLKNIKRKSITIKTSVSTSTMKIRMKIT